MVDDNIGEYCTLDKSGKRPTKELTTAEKEQMFLEAMAVRACGKRGSLQPAVLQTSRQ